MKKSILILGGASDIGLAIARYFAFNGYDIKLAARQSEKLRSNISDFRMLVDLFFWDLLLNSTTNSGFSICAVAKLLKKYKFVNFDFFHQQL